METTSAPAVSSAPRLRRTLTLWDLILYGVIVIQPVAPMSVFGVLSDRGHGHVVTTILIAMVAMLFTAISYGKHGTSLSQRGFGLYLRWAGDQSGTRLRHGLEHGDGLYVQSDDLHHLVQPAGTRFRATGLQLCRACLWGWAVFFAAVFTVEYSGSENFGPGEHRTGRGHGSGDYYYFSWRQRITYLDIPITIPIFSSSFL